jgi:hypothetical protein
MIEINVLKIIQLLKNEMAGVIQDVASGMFACRFPETLERNSIVKVLAGMYLIAQVNAGFIKGIEDRQPALSQFFKSVVNHSRRTLRPRINGVPHQRSGERCVSCQP